MTVHSELAEELDFLEAVIKKEGKPHNVLKDARVKGKVLALSFIDFARGEKKGDHFAEQLEIANKEKEKQKEAFTAELAKKDAELDQNRAEMAKMKSALAFHKRVSEEEKEKNIEMRKKHKGEASAAAAAMPKA